MSQTFTVSDPNRFSLGDDITFTLRWKWWRHPFRRIRQWWRERHRCQLVVVGIDYETGVITLEGKETPR